MNDPLGLLNTETEESNFPRNGRPGRSDPLGLLDEGYPTPTIGEPSYWDVAKTGFREGISGALKFYEAPFKPIAREMGIPPGLEVSEWIKPSEEEMRRAGEASIPKQVVRGLAGLPGAIAKYGPISAVAGPIAGFAIPEATEAISEGKTVPEIAERTVAGAAMGAGFKYLPPALRYKVPGMAALFGGQSVYEGLREGMPVEEALKAGIAPATIGAILGAIPHGKPRPFLPRPGIEEPPITEILPTLPPPGPPPSQGLPARAEKQFRRFRGWGGEPQPYEGMESFGELGKTPTPQELWGVPRLGDQFRGYGAEPRPEMPGMEGLTEPLGKTVAPEPKPTVPPKFVQKRITAFDVPYLGELRELQGLVKRGEPGGKTFTSTPTENLNVGGYGSSYPNFMKNMRWTKEDVLRTLDKGMKGKKLGVKEQVIWDTANGEAEAIYKNRMEEDLRLFEERKVIAEIDPKFEKEETVKNLTGSLDNEIIRQREAAYGEGHSERKVNQEIRAVEKTLQNEAITLDAAEKELFDFFSNPEPTEPAPEVVSLREIFKSGRKEITEPELQNLPDVKSGARTPEDMRAYLESKGVKVEVPPQPSPTRVGEQLLPGMKVGLEMKGAKEGVAPTLEGTPLAEAARKAELERVQPGLFPKSGEPQLRLSEETPTVALPNDTLQPLINTRTAELKNAPPVMTAETSMEFPERIRTKDAAGAYDPETGTVWIARDKMASPDYALKTLNEEISHHAILKYLESKNADRFIDLTFRKYGNTLEKELSDLGYTFDFNTPEGRRQATLEKLGKLGETGEEAGLLKRMYAAIRTYLRDKFGIGQELTDAEIQTFITRSIGEMRKGKYEGIERIEGQVQGAPPQYRRQQELLPDEKRVQEHIVSKVSDTRTIGEKVKDASNNLYYYAVNKWWPVEKVAPHEAAKIRLSGPKGYGQATVMLEKGFLDPQSLARGETKWIAKGLEPILKPIVDAKELGSFVRYGVSKRAIEKAENKVWDEKTQKYIAKPIKTGIDTNDAKAIVDRYENQTIGDQTYKQYFDRLQTFQDNVLQYYRDSGMLSMDAYNQIKAKNLMYFPFYRALEERGPDGIGSATQPRSVIRRMRGGEEKVLDPIDSIVKNTYNLVMNAEKNMALQEFIKSGVAKEILPGMPGYGGHRHTVSLYEMKNSGFFQDMLEDASLGKTDAQGKFRLNSGVKKQLEDEIVNIFRPNFIKGKENMFVVYDKGQPRIFEIDPQLGRALHGMDKEATNMIVKIMNYPTQWLRAGAILSPEFMARNPLRDWFSAFIYAKHGFNPFNFFEGLADAGGKSDLYYKWLAGGGSQSSFVGMDRTALRQTAKQILDKKRLMGLLTGNDYKEITQHLITHPVQGLRTLSELSEMGTRLAVYKRALAKGMTQEEAILQSRESTIDFARIGAKSKALNMIIAFWNANVQGLDKLIRQLNFINKENRPVALRTFARATATITIPSLLLAWANEDDPRVQELPEWQKTLFWIIPTENHIWRIPKPFELGIIFGTVPELIMRWMKTDDPKTFEKIGSALTTGSLPGVIPTGVLPFIENWWNKSAFTGRPIVPRGKEELQPQYQYQPYTTEVAKSVGNVMSKLPYIGETGIASPAKIENLVRGWTGGLGMHLMRLAGRGMKEVGVTEERIEPSKTLSDIPFIKAFVSRYPGADSQSLHDFYDTYNKINSLRTSARTLMGEGKAEEATSLIQSHKDIPIQVYHSLNRVHRSLSKMRDAINKVYQNGSMTPEEKRQMIDQITLQMIVVAKATNERIGNLK